jgi:hypothetical protein
MSGPTESRKAIKKDDAASYVMSTGLLKHDVACIVADKASEFLDQSIILEEARIVAPILFAEVGDVFTHDAADRFHDIAVFRYRGRTSGELRDSVLERHSTLTGEKYRLSAEYIATHIKTRRSESIAAREAIGSAVPKNWLRFEHIEDGAFFVTTGGVRDAWHAWPLGDYYEFDNEGRYDENIVCLPLEKCYGFRPYFETCWECGKPCTSYLTPSCDCTEESSSEDSDVENEGETE